MTLALAVTVLGLGAAPRWLVSEPVQTQRSEVRLFAETTGPVSLQGADGGCVVQQNIAHCRAALPLGPTQLELRSDAGTSALQLFRYDLLDARFPGPQGTAFGTGAVHRPEVEVRCIGCHGELDGGTSSTGCATCHRDVAGRRYPHGPVAKGECVFCHSVNERNTRLGVRWPIQDTCFQCHVDIAGAMASKAFRHGPAAAGRCTTCHDPHGSAEPFWLRKSAFDLCTNCHTEKASDRHVVVGFAFGDTHPMRGRPHPVKPGQAFSCTGCHNPHAQTARFLFQFDATRREDLCPICHAK